MDNLPSSGEHIGGSTVTESQKILAEIKALKKENKMATYARIVEDVEENGGGESVSFSTVRRVFAASESSAGSHSYDHVLVPIRDSLLRLKDRDFGAPISPDLVDALKSIIMVQGEEVARLQEMNEHLETRIAFLCDQIEKKDRRMDEKDELIRQFMAKMLK